MGIELLRWERNREYIEAIVSSTHNREDDGTFHSLEETTCSVLLLSRRMTDLYLYIMNALRMYVCMYILYSYIRVCVPVFVSTHAMCMHACIYVVCIDVCMHACIYVICIDVCMHLSTNACMDVCLHSHVCMFACLCILVCMSACLRISCI